MTYQIGHACTNWGQMPLTALLGSRFIDIQLPSTSCAIYASQTGLKLALPTLLIGQWCGNLGTAVNRGNGAFTLYLPMSCWGWPHVSFYPVDGRGDFGGS